LIHLQNLPSDKSYTIKICDATGRIGLAFKNKTQLDISTVSNGIYFLKVEWEDVQVIKSFVKE